jgi:hypothetical protein
LADPFLLSTLVKFICGKDSITKLIAYSSNIKALFNARAAINAESAIDCRKIRDLNYAKNRFHSTQKPLGRFVLAFDALLATLSKSPIDGPAPHRPSARSAFCSRRRKRTF